MTNGPRLGIRAESEEPVLLGKTVRPVLLRDLVPGTVLAPAGRHGLELGHRRATLRRVLRAVLPHQIPHDVGPLEHDTSSSGAGRGLAEITKKRGLRHRLVDRRSIANGARRELDDRTGLDVPAGPDVMADAGRHRTQ